MNTAMKRIVSIEYLLAAGIVVVFYLFVGGFAWYWIPILFIAFDISMVGYIVNNRVGAITYNIGHSLIGPALLMTLYIATESQPALFFTLLWLFHIFVDRALGYGLKHETGFHHTHLGSIGKR
ncbi:DUF4260 domain-containing protein [Streptomyces caniscabiei]|uniref:DUF4260 domain-containing protein n=1 Tax=Streptomyces caniscabiei TaxID=2746961 RepID=UPI0029AC6ED4|nr:DUF4260 domain-containing protein [Streptomyces caniscabiei]MDX2776619.1 DUF4260 domain-containing protein [Streptomyces caniscabiei]